MAIDVGRAGGAPRQPDGRYSPAHSSRRTDVPYQDRPPYRDGELQRDEAYRTEVHYRGGPLFADEEAHRTDESATGPTAHPPGHRAATAPSVGRHRAPRTDRDYRARTFLGGLGLTTLGTVLPGSGFLAAGRRRLGLAILLVAVLLLGAAAWFGVTQRRELLHLAVKPDELRLLAGGLLVALLAWIAIVVATHRMVRPHGLTSMQRFLGSLFVGALCLVVAIPFAMAARYAYIQSDLIDTLFGETDSATTPEVSAANPWGDDDRVNVMLLGGDGGVDRVGIRTDTVMVASIDTETGNTVLLSLPRNLEEVPFPKGTALHRLYPDGFTGKGSELEWMLNAVYRNVPALHPGVLGETDNEGADALKLAASAALGIDVDYYVLVNLDGFKELVDAMGGVTVNINEPIPIGGNSDQGIPPEDYLDPGANRHLNGFDALWYSRGRYGLDDYNRMERQRCMIDAIIDEANPANLFRRYADIAKVTKEILRTDIPKELLEDFVDLALEVKDAKVRSVVFRLSEQFNPGDPDYEWMHKTVAKAMGEGPGGKKPKDKVAPEAEDTCGYNPVS